MDTKKEQLSVDLEVYSPPFEEKVETTLYNWQTGKWETAWVTPLYTYTENHEGDKDAKG